MKRIASILITGISAVANAAQPVSVGPSGTRAMATATTWITPDLNSALVLGAGSLVVLATVGFVVAKRKRFMTALRNKKAQTTSIVEEVDSAPTTIVEKMQSVELSPATPPEQSMHAPGSPNGLLAASAQVDPVWAVQSSNVTLELLRHLKAIADKMLAKASTIFSQAENARAQNVPLNEEMECAEVSARKAHEILLKVSSLNDQFDTKHSAAALLVHHSVLNEAIALMASGRVALIAAMTSWNAGMRKAEAQRAAAEAAIAQASKFLSDAVRTSQEAGVDTGVSE